MAGMTPNLPPKAKALLDATNVVVVITINPDGTPQATPVWARLDGEDILVSTVRGRKKTRNLERDPRASVFVLDPENPLSYFSVTGSVTLTDDPGGSLIQELSQKYAGRPYTWDAPGTPRVIVRVTPQTVVGQ
jgi:PPOX class probable F420-dependent enzyme